MVVSWRLHRKWAERLGIDLEVSRTVDAVMDEVQPDRWPSEVVNRLARLRATKRDDFDRALILHVLLDKLRDFMKRLLREGGDEPVRFLMEAEPGVLLDVAKMLMIDVGRVDFNMLREIDGVVKQLKPHSREVVEDVLSELGLSRDEGVLSFGKRWRKYLRYIVERVPEFRRFMADSSQCQ